MAFPTTPILDDFNRADEALSASSNWTDGIEDSSSATGTLQVVDNTLQAGALDRCSAYWSAEQFSGHVEAYITLAEADREYQRVWAHVQNPNVNNQTCGYFVERDHSGGTDAIYVWRMDDDVKTKLGADIAQEISTGDSFGLEIEDGTITVWYKPAAGSWTALATRSDSTYTSGYLGISIETIIASTVKLDSFGGGEVSTNASITAVAAEVAVAVPTPTVTAEIADATAPDTSITDGPSDPTTSTGATFTLSADEEDCTFEVQLDGGSWEAASGTPANGSGVTTCSHSESGLSVGEHALKARATDASDNTDATPAEWSWTVQEAPAGPVSVVRVTRPEVPLRLVVNVRDAGGVNHRLAADEPDPARSPQGLEFSTTMPGGHERASIDLTRRPDFAGHDTDLLLPVEIAGPGRRMAWEGYIDGAPRSSGRSPGVQLSAVGWQGVLDDDSSAQPIYVSRDLSRWESMPSARRLALLALGTRPFDGQVDVDEIDGDPELRLQLTAPWAEQVACESWFDAGAARIGKLYLARTSSSTAADEPDASFIFLVRLADDLADTNRTNIGSDRHTEIADSDAGAYVVPTTPQRVAYLTWQQASGKTGSGDYLSRISDLAVYGDHGLDLHGDEPGGVLASDAIDHALATWAPQLDEREITPTTFVIPDLAWFEPTTVAEIVAAANRFHLYDWACWGRRFVYAPPGEHARRWLARSGPANLQEAGDRIDFAWNGVLVEFTDVDGTTRCVGPPGSSLPMTSDDLLITDPAHPANVAGRRRWTKLMLGRVTSAAGAIEIGRRFLTQASQINRAGQAEIVGTIRDDRGVEHAAWEVRAGDEIAFVDAADSSWRRIVRTSYSAPAATNTLDLDAPPEGLDALLERLSAVLVPLGL